MSAIITNLWVKVAGFFAGLAVLAGLYVAIRRGGKQAARAEAAIDVAKRTRDATQARIEAQRTPTPKEEADDPWNRDTH